VKGEFEKLGLHPVHTGLGEVLIEEDRIAPETLALLESRLEQLGFEIIDDKRSRIIEKIRTIIIEAIHHNSSPEKKYNWSTMLSDELHYDYNYLSSLFSSVEGITIEQFIIRQKIEKVKEFIVYDELTLSEIADRLGYSSVAHLGNQFKKVTGLTPSEFRNSSSRNRNPLDQV
jgi:AraC-like DNA-binding protein